MPVESIKTWADDPDADLPACAGVTVTDHQPVDPADEGVPEGPLPDPALASAVLEIEEHIAAAGWDQPARLYALVDDRRPGRRRARAGRGDGPRRVQRRRAR